MSAWIPGIGGGVERVLAWLLTYAMHSTLLLGAAALLGARVLRSDAWRDTLWKAALVGGVLTASVQAWASFRPLAGDWPLRGAAAAPDLAGAADAWPQGEAGPAALAGTAGHPAGAGVAEPAFPALADAAAADAGLDLPDAGATATSPTATSSTATSPVPTLPVRGLSWPGLALGAWLLGAALLLARLVRRQWRLHRLLRDRREVVEGELQGMLAELRRNAGIWRPVRLTASAACPTPLALGTAEICVPERFLSALDVEQQRSALAHELAHLARRDPAWHLAAGVIEALFFFQPLNRAARQRLRESAEHLCDDWAVHQTGSALGLARCLAEVASWVGRGRDPVPSGTMAMAEGGSPLLRRVQRLLEERGDVAPHALSRRAGAAATLLLAVACAAPAVSAGTGGAAGIGRESGIGEASGSGEATSGAEPGGGATQDPVIRHPAPRGPVEPRWAWAVAEAARRGARSYWVAYAFERPLPGDRIVTEDSHGWSTSEWDLPPLGELVFGPAYERPAKGSGPVPQPVLVLLHVQADGSGPARLERVSARSASVGLRRHGEPLFWLGMAAEAESFDWLRGRFDELRDAQLRAGVVEAIALHPTSARVVPFLAAVARSDRPDLREEAVEALEWHPTEEAVQVLRRAALEDQAPFVRKQAAEALGGIRLPAASRALAEIVKSSAPRDVRDEAVESLGGHPAAEVLEILVQVAMEDPDPRIAGEAVEAIAGFPASASAPLLERIVRTHPSRRIRGEAVEALAELDREGAADVLLELLRSDVSADVREEALDALAERASPQVLEAVAAAALSDPDPRVQHEAVEKLGEFGAAAAPHLLRIAFEHPALAARRAAAEALGELPAEAALPALDEILSRHEDGPVLRQAVESLGEFPADLSVPRLLEILRSHPREEARREALDQLGDRIGSI